MKFSILNLLAFAAICMCVNAKDIPYPMPPAPPAPAAKPNEIQPIYRWPKGFILSKHHSISKGPLGDGKERRIVSVVEIRGVVQYDVSQSLYDRAETRKQFPEPQIGDDIPKERSVSKTITIYGVQWQIISRPAKE